MLTKTYEELLNDYNNVSTSNSFEAWVFEKIYCEYVKGSNNEVVTFINTIGKIADEKLRKIVLNLYIDFFKYSLGNLFHM